jgi:DNA polymerase-3 subunit delta'
MSFAECKDQQQVVKLLQRSLERGRLGHAYLFTGNSLSVLEAMAQTLAKTLNCLQPKRAPNGIALDCCDSCSACHRIANFGHPDVQWVRPESKSRAITIDQVRDLMQTIHLKPMEAAYKVGIIVAADRMNVQSANAFLKTLEEPPPKSVLILLSSEPGRLLETIYSRCLVLSFAGGSGPALLSEQVAWLKQFSEMATQENQTLLGRYRLLGLLLSRLAQLKERIEKDLTQRSPLERYADAETSLREKWEAELAAAVEAEYRRQRSDVLVALQWWLRDVWLCTQRLGADQICFQPLAPTTQGVAGRLSTEAATENLRVIEKTHRLLETNVQEALVLEVGLLKLSL